MRRFAQSIPLVDIVDIIKPMYENGKIPSKDGDKEVFYLASKSRFISAYIDHLNQSLVLIREGEPLQPITDEMVMKQHLSDQRALNEAKAKTDNEQ